MVAAGAVVAPGTVVKSGEIWGGARSGQAPTGLLLTVDTHTWLNRWLAAGQLMPTAARLLHT